jgi:transcriptional regulator with XRE-family HTH domain
MEITDGLSDETLLTEIGERMGALRLARNLTQAQLAKEAGVSRRTVERLEAGAVSPQLSIFLRICRVLGLVERLELLLPPPEPGPIELLKRKQVRRKRARRAKEQDRAKWSWSDE